VCCILEGSGSHDPSFLPPLDDGGFLCNICVHLILGMCVNFMVVTDMYIGFRHHRPIK